MNTKDTTLDTIIALCKRKGFVYQTAEIYGGLNGVYDFGHLGTLLKENIRKAWINHIYQAQDAILLYDGSLLGPEGVWKASGHIDNFHDPMVDCMVCKRRYRTDEVSLDKACPHCGNKQWTDVRNFNMMFNTTIGAAGSHTGYLRPETAQTIFANFKAIYSSNRVKIPFGVAQIGKAFRNEINPKHFLFRVREFEQMELEWFCHEKDADAFFEFWKAERLAFHKSIGLKEHNLRMRSYEPEELAHYSKATCDIEYQFPFGWKELEGIAHRGTFDLSQHAAHSKKDLMVHDEENKTSYIPTIIESSVGIGRLFLALMLDAYDVDVADGEERVVLRFNPTIAPIKACCMPLTKKQTDVAERLYKDLKKTGHMITFDDGGSIGKRYRRQDEMGTPFCITVDFQTEEDQKVTIRHRDSMEQVRIGLNEVRSYITNALNNDQ